MSELSDADIALCRDFLKDFYGVKGFGSSTCLKLIRDLEGARARLRECAAPLPEWRDDCFGMARSALYLGKLYVGSINHWDTKRAFEPWRGWFMSDDEGAETGWFDNEDEARKSVEDALAAALKDESGEAKP